MVSFPNAKINIGLNIVSKRADGYHNIESCFYPIGWTDVLEIVPAETFSFISTGLPIPGNEENNLCCKAYKLLHEKFDIPTVQIHLHKVIPMGAGLGGGSADGSFALTMLNELFGLGIGEDELRSYAAELGSDCPFFINNSPVFVEGTGEKLTPIPFDLTGYKIMLIHPHVHISTQDAYASVTPKPSAIAIMDLMKETKMSDWKGMVINDFEKSFESKFEAIQDLKDFFYTQGAIYSSMTGSGSTVYGLFENGKNLDEIASTQPEYTCWKGTF